MEVKRSVWAEMSFIKIILFWLILPVVVAAIVAKNYIATIDNKRIIIKSGVFNKHINQYAIAGITEINVNQTFWGRIFSYGNVSIALAGNKHVSLSGIKDPDEVKSYLEGKLSKTADTTHMFVN